MLFDLSLEELHHYKPERTEPADFDRFWQETLEEVRSYPLEARFTPFDVGLSLVDVFDVSYRGYGGHTIRAWLLLPTGVRDPLPCVVEFIGYGGGRGLPFEWLLWSNAGYAHFVMDTRGQGSIWRQGDTSDPEGESATPQAPGFMTRGILSPSTYYYRRVYADAVRAVETARACPRIRADKIALVGTSQGGGITLAVAGLVPDIAAAMPDVPFLCHMRKATEITDADPYQEIVRFCRNHRTRVDSVLATLEYFDGVNFAARARCPALFSVGLMDDVCPPRTVFAAYNYYAGPREIRVWPYNKHEGGQGHQIREQIRFLHVALGG
jgi:cephalosporin-C deacetylase